MASTYEMTNFSKITDYDIQALVDGELDGERSRYLQAQMQNCDKLKRRYEELIEQKECLKNWWEETVN